MLIIEIFKKLKNIIVLLTVTFSFFFTFATADIYKEIKVEGNERLSVETVVMFSGLNLSNNITTNDLNSSIKKLYKTNYFKNIKIFCIINLK